MHLPNPYRPSLTFHETGQKLKRLGTRKQRCGRRFINQHLKHLKIMEFPLHSEVILNNGLEAVENCLKAGEDPNARDDHGSPPLHCINYYDDEAYKMVQLLLNYGADMYGRDRLGRLPFEHALECANKKACQTFVERGFSLQKPDRMRNGAYELLHNLELFHPEAVEVLQLLVDLRVDLSATLSSTSETLLHKAVESGASIETVQFLISTGVSMNSTNSLGMTPVHMLRYLDCTSNPVDKYDEELSRHSKLVKLFVMEGYNINNQDIFGRTLLHYVVSELRQSSLVQFLVNQGADLNIKDKNGITTLHLACFWNNTANLREVIRSGCAIDAEDKNGATIFHYTVFYNSASSLTYLLTQCDSYLVSKPDSSGRTPIQWARYFGYVKLIDILENYFLSLNSGFQREEMLDLFPLKEEFNDILKQEEVENMQSKDFCLNGNPNRTLKKLLNSPVIGQLQEITETQDIKSSVRKVIERVATIVSKAYPLFTFVPEVSGSVSEGTKCGFPDEFDFLCKMVKLSECFQEPDVESSPPMFCQLQLKPDLCLSASDQIMQYVDEDKSLRSAKLVNDFSDQLNRAFFAEEIWYDIPSLAPLSVCLMGANATKITLKWCGQVYRDLLISVDIVPALHFPRFWPPDVCETPLLHAKVKGKGIHVVMALHAESFFKSGEKHFRLSFSLAETAIFQALPEHVHSGYILAKAVRSTYVCPQIAPGVRTVQELLSSSNEARHSEGDTDQSTHKETERALPEDNNISAEKVISSYFLKNALYQLVNKHYKKHTNLDLQNTSEDQVITWATSIYDFLDNCLEQGNLPSFFFPKLNLLEKKYDSEQHSKVFYGGLEFHPMDEDLMQDLDDVLEGTREPDVEHLRKPFIKMLKGILQSSW